MISDPETIQKLSFRSNLPRLSKEGFFLFVQLEAEEQKLEEPALAKLLGQAFAELVARETSRTERPLPTLLPRAYRWQESAADWVEIEYACDLAEPYERRNRAGNVLGITNHLKGRVRLYKGAFAYFTPDDFSPLETLDAPGFTSLS